MSSNPLIRLIGIFSLRWHYLLAIGICGSLLTGITSIFSSYLYESTLVLEIQADKDKLSEISQLQRAFSGVGKKSNSKMLRVIKILNSTEMFEGITKALIENEEFDMSLAFPYVHSIFDVKNRIKIASRHMNKGIRTIDKYDNRKKIDPKSLVTSLHQHLDITNDLYASTIRIDCTSASTKNAYIMCNEVKENIKSLTIKKTRIELAEKNDYFHKKIQGQLTIISNLEEKLRDILEINPEIGVPKGKQGGSIYAIRYAQTAKHLRETEVKIQTNKKMLELVTKVLNSEDVLPKEISEGLRNQLLQEISEQEYKRLELISVRKLSKRNPRVRLVNKTIGKLRSMLLEIGMRATPRSIANSSLEKIIRYQGLQDLQKMANELFKSNTELRVQGTAYENALNDIKSRMKSGVKLEFEADNLRRQINTASETVKTLAILMQNASFESSVSSGDVKVLLDSTVPLYASNLSIRKKMFFSFFIALAIGMFLLGVFDLYRPLVIFSSEIKELKLNVDGPFKINENAINNITGSLVVSDHIDASENKHTKTLLFTTVGVEINLNSWVKKIALNLSEIKENKKIGLVSLGYPTSLTRSSKINLNNSNVILRSIDPRFFRQQFEPVINELNQSCDTVILILPNILLTPFKPIILKFVNAVYYILKSGQTTVDELNQVKSISVENFELNHKVLLLKT